MQTSRGPPIFCFCVSQKEASKGPRPYSEGAQTLSRQEPRAPFLLCTTSLPCIVKMYCEFCPLSLEKEEGENDCQSIICGQLAKVNNLQLSRGPGTSPDLPPGCREKTQKVQISDHVGPTKQSRVALHCCKTFISVLHLDPGLINSSKGMRTASSGRG